MDQTCGIDLLVGALIHVSKIQNDAWLLLSGARASIMEANNRQVTTVFTVQLSFHHRHSTNRVS